MGVLPSLSVWQAQGSSLIFQGRTLRFLKKQAVMKKCLSNKRNIYIDIDGVISGKKNINDYEIILAEYAFEFLKFYSDNFNCFWLSTHSNKGKISDVVKYLIPYTDVKVIELVKLIKPLKWQVFKVKAIDLASDFIWVDDELSWCEKKILVDNNVLDRWLYTNTNDNPDDLLKALNTIKKFTTK
jgi:hypothetical protein